MCVTVCVTVCSVAKYVSPEERARREEADRQAEEARRRAESDDARQRALREMMNNTVELRKMMQGKRGPQVGAVGKG